MTAGTAMSIRAETIKQPIRPVMSDSRNATAHSPICNPPRISDTSQDTDPRTKNKANVIAWKVQIKSRAIREKKESGLTMSLDNFQNISVTG